MGIEDSIKGVPPTVIKSEEADKTPVYQEELDHALKFLKKHNNKDFADLLNGLTEEARKSLYLELGGSWRDIIEERNYIEKAKEALEQYVASMLTDDEKHFGPKEKVDQKNENRKNAIKMLKASIVL